MHNWYAIEVEAESRRQEWERERVKADRAAQVEASANGHRRFSGFRFFRPQVSLRSLVVPLGTASAPRPAGC
jgi:hypothetical protein